MSYKPVSNEVSLPDGFIVWRGGECPVDPYDVVQVVYRSGMLSEPGFTAHNYQGWRHEGRDEDVVAYKCDGPADGGVNSLDR